MAVVISKCLFQYSAQNEDELSVEEADIILITSQEEDWSHARILSSSSFPVGSEGILPTSYTEPLEPKEFSVEFDYEASNDAELSIYSGETVKKFCDVDGWSIIAKNRDSVGFVPANYLFDLQQANLLQNQNLSSPHSSSPARKYSDRELSLMAVIGNDDDTIDQQQQITADFDDEFNHFPAVSTSETQIAVFHQPEAASKEKKYPVTAIIKVGKKTKNKNGFLFKASNFVKFLDEKDDAVIQEWKSHEITKITREKKNVHLEFESIGFDFVFKSKPEAVEFCSSLEKSGSNQSISSIGSNSSDIAPRGSAESSTVIKGMTSKKFGSMNSIPVISSPLVGSFVHRKHSTSQGHKESPLVIDAVTKISPAPIPLEPFEAIAAYDYQAQNDNELDVLVNEQFSVTEEVDGWSKIVKSNGQSGFVPTSYIQKHVQNQDSSALSPQDYTQNVALPSLPERSPDKWNVPPKPPRQPLLSPVLASNLDEPPPKPSRPIKNLQKTINTETIITREPSLIEIKESNKINDQSDLVPALPQRPALSRMSTPSTKSKEHTRNSSAPSIQGTKILKEVRLWSDKSGSFQVEAELVGVADGKILLHKTNGVKIGVPFEKLSKNDINYVSEKTGHVFPLSPTEDPNNGKEKAEVVQTIYKGFDWKRYFVSVGIDENDSTRYAQRFVKEKLEKDLIKDLNRGTLKELGVAEGDIIRILKSVETEKKPQSVNVKDTPFSNSASSLFQDPEVKARILEAERLAKVKTELLLTAASLSKRPSGTSSPFVQNKDDSLSKEMMEKQDEEFARKLQEQELRAAGMLKKDVSPQQSIPIKVTNDERSAVKVASEKNFNNDISEMKSRPISYHEQFKRTQSERPVSVQRMAQQSPLSWNTDFEKAVDSNIFDATRSLSLSSPSSDSSTRRGRVQANSTVDPQKIFNAAKVTASPARSFNQSYSQQPPSANAYASYSNSPVSFAQPLIPLSSNSRPMSFSVKSGDETPNISVAGQQRMTSIQNTNVANTQPSYNNSIDSPVSYNVTMNPLNSNMTIMQPQFPTFPSYSNQMGQMPNNFSQMHPIRPMMNMQQQNVSPSINFQQQSMSPSINMNHQNVAMSDRYSAFKNLETAPSVFDPNVTGANKINNMQNQQQPQNGFNGNGFSNNFNSNIYNRF